MAKVLKKFEFKASTFGQASTYDWATLLDGKIYMLAEGEDYKCSTGSMMANITGAAAKAHKKVNVNRTEGGIVMQAGAAFTEEEVQAYEEKQAAMKERYKEGEKARKPLKKAVAEAKAALAKSPEDESLKAALAEAEAELKAFKLPTGDETEAE